jgi:hypothetical protein
MTGLKKPRYATLLVLCLSLFLAHAATPHLASVPAAMFFAPELRSINPDEAAPGGSVVIKGRDFSTEESENIVLFGGLPATVRKAKRRKLVVTVPVSLLVGNHSVTVSVAGETSNSLQFTAIPPIIPLQGEYVGQTSQSHRLSFEVFQDRTLVTRLRTTFNCTSNVCAVVVPVSIDRFMDIRGRRFGTTISTPEFSADIQGEFVNETEAEGTFSFSIGGGCSCGSGELRWSARLR